MLNFDFFENLLSRKFFAFVQDISGLLTKGKNCFLIHLFHEAKNKFFDHGLSHSIFNELFILVAII